MEKNNKYLNRINLISEELKEKIMCDDILVHILKFLNIRDLAFYRQTSKQFYTIIEEDKSIILSSFDMSSYEKEINLKWLKHFLKEKYLNKVNLLLCEDFIISRDLIYLLNASCVDILKVSVNIFLEGNEITKFKYLKSITVKNMHFNETGEEESINLVKNLIQMPWIEKIKLNNIKYLKASFLKNLDNKRVTLIDFKESIDFIVDDMESFLYKHKSSLKVLKIDGEYSSQHILENVLLSLENLNELYICYCENFNDNLLNTISKISHKLHKLSLRKLRNVSEKTLALFVENSSFDKLEKLDLYDCPNINSNFVNVVGNKAPLLKFLDLSWSNAISTESIVNLLRKCLLLEKLNLQGCKYLDETMFSPFIDKKTQKSAFLSLKIVDLSKCDLIHDKIMSKFTELYPGISFYNYYGNLISE